MSRAHRILLVEDRSDSAELYARRLRAERYEVDIACGAADAVRFLQEKAYDVAVVDMNLTGIPHDRSGGEVVLRVAKGLAEPLGIVVLTGEENAQFAADLLQDWGVSRYIAKSMIIDRGFQVVLNHIRLALPSPDEKGGPRTRIIDILAGAEEEVAWVDNALRVLRPKDGYSGLVRFLEKFLGHLTPLFPVRFIDGPALRTAPTARALEGDFWSKRIGSPVLLRVAAENSDHAMTPSSILDGTTVGDIVCEHTDSGVVGQAWSIRGASRNEFA